MDIGNPFFVSGYHSPSNFCDREKETDDLCEALYNGRNVTLMSPRRMGKTGLMQHVLYQIKAQNPKANTFYLDIFPTQNRRDLVQMLAASVLGHLDTAPQKALQRIGKFIKSIRPVLSVDAFTGSPKVSVDVAPEQEEATLKEIFDYLRSSEQPCYIAIDEFQQLAEYPEKGTEALLRTHIQSLSRVHFIFAGSKQHLIQEMFLSAKRPFYQSTQLMSLDVIERTIYYRFAAGFFQKIKCSLSEEVFFYLYDLFEGHTWYIQVLLNRLYAYRKAPSLRLVDVAVQEIVQESAYPYERLLSAYNAGHIALLKALAREGCVKEIYAGHFIARHRLKTASSVNTALTKLIDKELICASPQGYKVYDRFMDIWLRQQSF